MWHRFVGYLSRHVWDIVISALIVYEIAENFIVRHKSKKDASKAERQPPSIRKIGGEPGALRISGRAIASGGPVSGPQQVDRNGLVTIANLVSQPITIGVDKLVIGGQQVPVCAYFQKSESGRINPKTESTTISGSACADYDLILRFAESTEPRQTTGKLCFWSSNRGRREKDLIPVDIVFP